jgi:hypothetical protein
MPGWAARALDDLPLAAAESGAPWYPLQHAFGFSAFGANVFVAGSPGTCSSSPTTRVEADSRSFTSCFVEARSSR